MINRHYPEKMLTVSIVMPSLNQVKFINAALRSVLDQDFRAVELIIADGGSTDGTCAVLERCAAQDSRLRWFSKQDSGPAEALNLALSQVRGSIIGWLNADDLYTPGAIRRAVESFSANQSSLMVYGQGEHIDEQGRFLNTYPTLPPDTPLEQFSQGCFICQPTVFFRRTLHLLLGPLDQSLKTAFDFDYWLRAFKAFEGRIGFVDALQAQSRLHKDCITLRQRSTVILEGMEVLSKTFGHAPKEWMLTYLDELLDQAGDAPVSDDLRSVMAEMLNAVRWQRCSMLQSRFLKRLNLNC